MNVIENAYINALLADATYGVELNASGNVTADELKRSLAVSMTPTLAKYIADSFTVVSSIKRVIFLDPALMPHCERKRSR